MFLHNRTALSNFSFDEIFIVNQCFYQSKLAKPVYNSIPRAENQKKLEWSNIAHQVLISNICKIQSPSIEIQDLTKKSKYSYQTFVKFKAHQLKFGF
jgi:hypothetical protein